MEPSVSSSNYTMSNSSSLAYETQGDERLMAVMYRTIEDLSKKVHKLETTKILEETQIPAEILNDNGLLPKKPSKFKNGAGYRPILKSEIEEAKQHSQSAAGQARWLGVCDVTYKKYAKMYGIYDPKPNIKGKWRNFDPSRGKYSLNRILTGELNGHPSITEWMVKKKLIQNKTFPARCNICGYDKHRIGDNKLALLLDHKDGDRNNFKLENLQLLCLNCTFECGRGYIRRGNKLFDPDWIQGAKHSEIDPVALW